MYYCISAAECLEVLKNDNDKNIRLILSDINMLEMDGLQLLDIVPYMVSAYHSTKYSDEADEKGANGFFAKPVNLNSLKDCIQKT